MAYTPRTFTKNVWDDVSETYVLNTQVAETAGEDVDLLWDGWSPGSPAPVRPPFTVAQLAALADLFGGSNSGALIVVDGDPVNLDNTQSDGFIVGYWALSATTFNTFPLEPGCYVFKRASAVASGWRYWTLGESSPLEAIIEEPVYHELVLANGATTFLRFEGNATNAGSIAETYTPTAITYGTALGDGSQAAVFNGTSSMLAAPQGTGTGLAGATTFSVEALVNVTSFGATRQIGYQLATWNLGVNSVGRLVSQIENIGSLTQPSGGLTAGVTAHVAMTFDGATLRFYINGAEVASGAMSGTMTNYGTAPALIGSNGTAEFFEGSMDGYAIYRNIVLSPAEILADAQAAGLA